MRGYKWALRQVVRKAHANLSDFLFVAQFVLGTSGREYGLAPPHKIRLVSRIRRNNRKVRSLTTWQQHIILIDQILRIPGSWEGDVVECGYYNGASSISLSIACTMTGRRLFICDSFEGLPEPDESENHDIHADSRDYYVWEEGEFRSEGGLESVRKNIRDYGKIEVCEFLAGYFSDTLPALPSESIVFVFEDADIRSSVKDCILYLWPKLREGGHFYCHEPWSINVVSLFYDAEWWKLHFNSQPPGFFGSGNGTIAGLNYSSIGYAVKFDSEKIRKDGKKIVHDGSRGFR